MAKKRKTTTTTKTETTTAAADELQLSGSFKDERFSTLVEMFDEEVARGLYLKGAPLEEHKCAEDSSCYHLHNPKFANIFLNAQKAFEEEWAKPVGERNLRTVAAKPLMNGRVFGVYKARRGSDDGFVWYQGEREVLDEETGAPTGELETQWRLKRVEDGEDLGKDRNRYVMAQCHHGHSTDCWIDHRGSWRPNLWQFDRLYYLIPLTQEEKDSGITERIRVKAWDFLQGSDLELLSRDVGDYILAKEMEKIKEAEIREEEKKAQALAEEGRRANRLAEARLKHEAAQMVRKIKQERKQEAREVLRSINIQFLALCKSVDSLQRNIKKTGTTEFNKYVEAVKANRIEPRSALWLRRRHNFQDYVLTNWSGKYVEDGNIFSSLVALTAEFIPQNLWEVLEVTPGLFVKVAIDEVQTTNG